MATGDTSHSFPPPSGPRKLDAWDQAISASEQGAGRVWVCLPALLGFVPRGTGHNDKFSDFQHFIRSIPSVLVMQTSGERGALVGQAVWTQIYTVYGRGCVSQWEKYRSDSIRSLVE